MHLKKKNGFSIVELIITITVLSILGLIAFVNSTLLHVGEIAGYFTHTGFSLTFIV